jgi:hypothetical protein
MGVRIQTILRQRFPLVAITICSLWVNNCSDPSTTQSCQTEQDCRFGEICRDNRCLVPFACDTNGNCPATEVCASGICQPQQCDDHDMCGDDRICLSRFCHERPAGFCAQDIDCVSGQCDLMHSTCTIEPPCSGDACLPDATQANEICDMGLCQTACQDGGCALPYHCDPTTRQCAPMACDTDGTCPSNMYCKTGQCQMGCRLSPDTCAQGRCDATSHECVLESCNHHRDCQGGTCRIQWLDNRVEHRCSDESPPVSNVPCTRDEHCISGACTTNQFCYWPCRDQDDCRDGQCRIATWSIDGQSVDILSCESDHRVCANDIDCPSGQSCLPLVQADQTLLKCRPSPPGRSAGAPCGQDEECQSTKCTEGYCWGPCEIGHLQHCGGGRRCYPDIYYLPAQAMDAVVPYIGFAGCLPHQGSGTECSSLSCQDDDICLLRPDHTRSNWTFRCFTPRGAQTGGTVCQHNLACRSAWCGPSGYCIEPCSDMGGQEMCMDGSLCENVLLELWSEEGEAVLSAQTTLCVP